MPCLRELRQCVDASCGTFAREAPDFLETESGVQMHCGSVIRPAHIEDVAGASDGPRSRAWVSAVAIPRPRHAGSTRTCRRGK